MPALPGKSTNEMKLVTLNRNNCPAPVGKSRAGARRSRSDAALEAPEHKRIAAPRANLQAIRRVMEDPAPLARFGFAGPGGPECYTCLA